ncbi:hypothetical protein QW060_24845 [Myroides ceti]|uniref:Uncharacterized protein n=1 Tax=Paenimyroides ceti TaxID=395087 RepID=A0ABT8D0S7_9FLAO|nr:hypothetical protein [Paenimyroides ceti]MDN3710115.1 hypothetical protein [Paenimyroides ceti]
MASHYHHPTQEIIPPAVANKTTKTAIFGILFHNILYLKIN